MVGMAYQTRQQELLEILREKSVLHTTPDKPFKLVSGKESLVYVDVRLTALDNVGMRVIAQVIISELVKNQIEADLVAGVVVGGCPLATSVSLISSRYFGGCHSLNALYVRKEAKDHGTTKLIEGTFQVGDRVILLEDVVTSGGSTLGSIKTLRDAGLEVKAVIAVLDREEGGRAKIEETGVPFYALTTLKELLGEG